MLPAEDPNRENTFFSSSSSTSSSPIADPPPQPQHIHRNNGLQENRAAIDILETELLCDESFSEIIEKEEAEVVTLSDACSTNSTVFALNYERKRRRSPSTDEEEDGNATEAVSDGTKFRRINETGGQADEEMKGNKNEEREHLQIETGEDYRNQESVADKGEEDSINQEKELAEGEKKEPGGNKLGKRDEDQNGGGKRKRPLSEPYNAIVQLCYTAEEEGEKYEHKEQRENAGGEDTINHQNSEQNDSGNQESEQNVGEEDRENDENREENDEEEERKAAEKGKSPMSELYDSIVPICSTAEEEGEKHKHKEHRENAGAEHSGNHQNSEQNDSGKKELEQNEGEEDREIDENQEDKRKAAEKGKRPMSEICKLESVVPKFSKFEHGGPSDIPEGDQTDNELNNNQYDNDDHQDLAILKSIWHFNCNNGYIPYPQTDELHNHIMDSIPNIKILGEDLTKKIVALEDNFNTVRELDGGNPDMARPVNREIFDLSMRLWGNSEDNIGHDDVEQQNQQEYYGVNILNSTTAYDDDDDLLNWVYSL